MSKSKKKRNKKYTGADASTTRPSITKVQAVSRNRLSQWIFERQKAIKLVRNGLLVVLGLAIIISGIISLF